MGTLRYLSTKRGGSSIPRKIRFTIWPVGHKLPEKGTFTDQGSRTPSFLLHQQRKYISARNGGFGFNTENTLITMRVTYNTMRMEFTTGYHIDTCYWDAAAGKAIGNGSDGRSAEEINRGLSDLAFAARATAVMFSERGYLPTQEEFKESYQRIKYGGITTSSTLAKPKRGRPRKLDNQDKMMSKPTNT